MYSKRFVNDVRKQIGNIQRNIDLRNKETHNELMSLKEFIDLKLHPPKKGYLRFQTTDGFVEFKPRKKLRERGID
jgi:hypothetical protein